MQEHWTNVFAQVKGNRQARNCLKKFAANKKAAVPLVRYVIHKRI
jgi:hypothetical protein